MVQKEFGETSRLVPVVIGANTSNRRALPNESDSDEPADHRAAVTREKPGENHNF
jgi:hypothetical protein